MKFNKKETSEQAILSRARGVAAASAFSENQTKSSSQVSLTDEVILEKCGQSMFQVCSNKSFQATFVVLFKIAKLSGEDS